MLNIPLNTKRPDHHYNICVGDFSGAGLCEEITRAVPADSYVAVVDRHVFELHNLGERLPQNWKRYLLEAGEEHKTAVDFITLVEAILRDGIDRKTVVVAIGGGVIGDLAGFAAATLLRGVRFAQVPTTLLAQVDSSVGGKTGINMAGGKNLLGAFYQPEFVAVDPAFLSTLSHREYLSGLAEVAKYGVISDRDFFVSLTENSRTIAERDPKKLGTIIAHCCRMKAEIVGMDELESAQRQLLNLGHTFGHALEALAGYDGTILHGEAVSVGMAMAASFAVEEEGMAESEAAAMRDGFAALGLPWRLGDVPGISPERMKALNELAHSEFLVAALAMDKKAASGGLTLILPTAVGECRIVKNVPAAKVAKHILTHL